MKNFNRLLTIELYKIKNHKLSRVLFFIYFLLLSAIAFMAAIQVKVGPIKINLAEQGIFNFPYIWHFNTWVADFLTFFLAILVVSTVTNEFTYRTLKQNLIDGLTKKEFILSKFYFMVVLALAATFFVFVLSLILGFIYSDYTSTGIIFRDFYFLLAFFLKLLGIFSFIMFLGFLLKRSALAIGFFFVWMIAESIAYALMRWQFFGKNLANKIIAFFPYAAMRQLLPEPITRLSAAKNIGNQLGENMTKFNGLPFVNFVIVGVWISIFLFLSYKIIQKRDL